MNLKEPLRTFLPDNEVHKALKAYEVLGDMAIITLSPSHDHLDKEIARLIMSSHSELRLVAKRTNNHSGEFRTAPLRKIAGNGDFNTIHKEFGLNLHVNADDAYFSPRSGGERYRVAQQVTQGEHVLVMFSGVGPLVLMMGLHTEASRIVGVEKNPKAHKLALKNLETNKKVNNAHFIEGDVASVVPALNQKFDRIAMPLPLLAEHHVGLAVRHLLPEGILHFYDFQNQGDFELSVKKVVDGCEAEGREVVGTSVHRCGHVGPRKYRVCVDAVIC